MDRTHAGPRREFPYVILCLGAFVAEDMCFRNTFKGPVTALAWSTGFVARSARPSTSDVCFPILRALLVRPERASSQ